MFKKKNTPNHIETVADLRKSIRQSFFSRNKVKIMTGIARLKRSANGYKIPIVASTVFMILILSLGIVRQLQQTSLLAIINRATDGTDNYSTLLSLDEADEFASEDVQEPDSANDSSTVSTSNSTQSTSTSFSIDDTDNSGGDATSPGTSDPEPPSSGGGGQDPGDNTPQQPPFSASVNSFARSSTKLDCKNPSNPKIGACSKVYSFIARVSTTNGPGSVAYTWQSSQGSSSGTIAAGSGSTITSVTREIVMQCNKPTSFTIQFTITAPSVSSSEVLSINHNCNEL